MQGKGQAAIGQAAAVQRGLVHGSQLRAAGLGPGRTARLVRKGALYPILPRVYAVGTPALARLAPELAALLHLGHDALISHGSAARLWGMTAGIAADVEVTIVGRDARVRPGLRTYRVSGVDGRDVRFREGLAVTAPARTLIDFAAQASLAELARALAQARVLGLLTDPDLKTAIARCPGRAGVGALRALLKAECGPALTRSEAERRLLALIQTARLLRPEVNPRVLGLEVDFLWRAAKLVVEVDGHAFHGHRAAFERDRARDQTLIAAGYRVLRVTWRQLEHEPIAVAARIAQALAAASRGL